MALKEELRKRNFEEPVVLPEACSGANGAPLPGVSEVMGGTPYHPVTDDDLNMFKY